MSDLDEEVKGTYLSCRVSERTRQAFTKKAKRIGRRPSRIMRELIEDYAHEAGTPRSIKTPK